MSEAGNNSSIVSNSSYKIPFDFNALKYSYYGLYGGLILFGTFFNVWMMSALMTSPEMRLLLRNKLICVLLLNNLVKMGVVAVMEMIEIAISYDFGQRTDCSFVTFSRIMGFSVMWIENWYVLIFLLHYLFTLLDFNPVRTFSPNALKIGTIVILVGPWIFSLVVAPAVLASYSYQRGGAKKKGCLVFTVSAYKALQQFGIVAPYFIKVILLGLILLAYRRRKNVYSSMASSLISSNTKIDDVRVYVAVCAISFFTQAMMVAKGLNDFKLNGIVAIVTYNYLTWYLMEARVILLPPALLLLEDIRYRIKTWRPWYRPGPGIDLTVQYNQTRDENS